MTNKTGNSFFCEHCKLPCLLKGYECCELQHEDWKATNVLNSSIYEVQCPFLVFGGELWPPTPWLGARLLILICIHFVQMGWASLRSPQPPCHFVMQAQCQTAFSKKLRVLISIHFCKFKTAHSPASPDLPCDFVIETNISGGQKASCSYLYPCFANGGGAAHPPTPRCFIVHAQCKTQTQQRVQEAACLMF